MIPVWASIDFDFDQEKINQELLSNNIFEKREWKLPFFMQYNLSIFCLNQFE